MRVLRVLGLSAFTVLAAACGGDDGTSPESDPVRVVTTPAGWYRTPTASFTVGLDSTQRHGGGAAAFAQATSDAPTGSVVLMQSIRADAYQGKRVQLTGWVRPTNVTGAGAALWMRVDGPIFVQQFDNMQPRRILGSSGWRSVSIVLDVREDAVGISFGLMLLGGGDVLIDDLQLTEVSTAVPITALSIGFIATGENVIGGYSAMPTAPTNLDFEAR